MKLTMTRVLTPLAALAFTLGAQAKAVSTDDFESYAAGASMTNAAATAAGWSFWTTNGVPDESVVTTNAVDNKYLKLSTEDGVLFHNMDGTAETNDVQLRTGLYVDTDVQFTLTAKDDRPKVTEDEDKFIIWLEADEENASTNLCVWAREYKAENGAIVANSNKVYKLNSDDIVPGTWHRLTVKACQSINTSPAIPGFQVYLDGSNTPLSSDLYFLPDGEESSSTLLDASAQTLFDARTFFPAMADTLLSLKQVGFSGEGGVDNLVVTRDVPGFQNPTIVRFDFDTDVIASIDIGSLGASLTSTNDTIAVARGTSFTFEIHWKGGPSASSQYDVETSGDAYATVSDYTVTAGSSGSSVITVKTTAKDSTDVTFNWGAVFDDMTSEHNSECTNITFTIGGTTYCPSSEDFDNAEPLEITNVKTGDTIVVNVMFSNNNWSGAFKDLPTAYFSADGMTLTLNNRPNDGAVTVYITAEAAAAPKATVNGQECATLAQAIALAKNTANPVVLCDDITLEAAEAIAANEEVTIDLNGYTITGADDAAVFENAGTLIITDSSQDHDGGIVAGSDGCVVANTGTLSLEYGAYAGQFTNSGTFDITTDCVFDNDLDGAYEAEDGYEMAETFEGSGFYQLTAITYTITYMNDQTELTGLEPTAYTVEDDVTLPTTLPVVGVTLTGWKDGEDNAVTDWLAGAKTGNLTLYAQTEAIVPVTPWYDNPQAVVLAENLPNESAGRPSAFHGQGEGEYLGFTIGTNPQEFFLYMVAGTSVPTTVTHVTTNDIGDVNAGFRGVAISKKLGIAMTMAYAKTTTMYAFPLAGGNPTAVVKPNTHSFDGGAFSPDGAYFFSNALNGESSKNYYVKWSVATNAGVVTLTKVGSIAASGRGRNLAYARINERDLVFAMVDDGKVDVIDMTGDTTSAWTATTLASDLPAHSYGTLCVSGINATPHLTVAASNTSNGTDVLNVYELTVPASGTVTASNIKSFDQTAMTAAGFGDPTAYGNTVYVTDDEKTIYFARGDQKLYAAQYVEPAPTPSGEEIEPGQQSSTTYTTQADAEAALANVTITASAAVETALGDTSTYLSKFEKKVVESSGEYKIEIALTAAAETELEDEATTNVAVAVAAKLPDIAASATGSQTEISVTGVVPGFYYSISYGTAVNAITTEGPRALAGSSGSITLQTPAKASGATSGFYRVNVNVAPALSSGE